MTDIPRGPGGDGSPQLDLDAIEQLHKAIPEHGSAYQICNVCHHDWPCQTSLALALVRRLQQDVAFLTDALRCDSVALERVSDERNAARGRVEELTAIATHLLDAYFDACEYGSNNEPLATPGWHNCVSVFERADVLIPEARALLARVDPEKETP